MMFQYNSYVLEINPVSRIKGINVGILRGTCEELDFEFTNSSYDTIISEFKSRVDSLKKKEQMKKLTIEYKSNKCDIYKDDNLCGFPGYRAVTPDMLFLIKARTRESAIEAFEQYIDGEFDNRKESPCIYLVQKILKNTPESANELFQLLLNFKFKTEEGIGEKE